MTANGEGPDVHQEVTAQRDTYVAGRDINNFYIAAPEIQPVEHKLATVVLKQAQDARSLLIGTDVAGDETANVAYTRIPGRLREPKGREVGDLRSVLEYYQSLSPRRLVVIGEPGAGKTVLLLELQIRLLEERRENPETPIPVLISASACDTGKKWEDWLAGHLSLRFSIPERTAADLILHGRILPVVDGLDEMDPAGDSSPERAQALVRALNSSMRGLDRAPIVVTCRPGEYRRLAQGIDKARHVELSRLTGAEAAAYLVGQFRDEAERDRWKPVLETLERAPDGSLAAELATPWRLTLALAAFRGGGDPASLLPPGPAGGSYSAHVDSMLLDGYVPAAVSLHQEATPYTEAKVRGWLTSIADDLAWRARHGHSATDITLHEWWRPQRKWTAQVPYAVLMFLPYLVSIVISGYTRNVSVWFAAYPAIFGLGASGIFFLQTHHPQRAGTQRRLTGRLRAALVAALTVGLGVGFPLFLTDGLIFGFKTGLAAGLGDGLAVALAIGLTAWLMDGLTQGLTNGLTHGLTAGLIIAVVVLLPEGFRHGPAYGLTFGFTYGLTVGLMDGLAIGFTNFSPKVRRPHAIIRTNGQAGLAGGLLGGLAVGLTNWLAAGLTNGLNHDLSYPTYGITAGVTVGLTIWLAICAQIWIRYHVAVAWNAFRGKGPLRFGKFLRWAAAAGLLRESGFSYQFRHRQLQDWLTSTEERLSAAARRPRPQLSRSAGKPRPD